MYKNTYFTEFGGSVNIVIRPKKTPNASMLSKFTLSVHFIYFFTNFF